MSLASIRSGKDGGAGAMVSIFTGGVVNSAELPAKSDTVTMAVTPSPSSLTTTGLLPGIVASTPERASPGEKGKSTSELFQPAPLAKGFCIPKVNVGLVRSTLIGVSVTDALLPARSTAVPKEL